MFVTWVKNEFNTIEHKPNVYRKINAILSLSKTYTKDELDAAVGYAYEHNIVNHTSVKSILQKKLYLQTKTNAPINTSVYNDHDNLRGNIYS